MKKYQRILVFLLSITVLFLIGCKTAPKLNVCFEKNCFSVETATTPAEQERGLMYKNKMPQNEGMLFLFNESNYYSFWMKNTYIPLDIIWINESNHVVYVAKNVLPCKPDKNCESITPRVKANSVLELNAGIADKFSIKLGDKMQIRI